MRVPSLLSQKFICGVRKGDSGAGHGACSGRGGESKERNESKNGERVENIGLKNHFKINKYHPTL
jgi:hypothetical protein